MTPQAFHRAVLGAAIVIALLVTLGHYTSDVHQVALHNVYRRLYYVPVVLAAFSHGLRGGLVAAAGATLAYLPHAFFMEGHRDPAPAVDKAMEMVLYVVVGGLTGWLIERERAVGRALKEALWERGELEHELVRAAKLGSLGELVAGVAHEVRNPLASILGAAEGLERQPELGEQARRLLALQVREAGRLERVVSRFLDFAKATGSSLGAVKVEAVVDEIVELVGHGGAEGAFVKDQSLAGLQVKGDADHLTQILLNLTLNATQAAEPFAITYLYRRQRVGQKAYDCVGVRDEGKGVAAQHVERIFDPFFTTRPEGTGLGLSISSRLAEAQGGHLKLEQGAEGTTFWLCLPAPKRPKESTT